MNNGEFRALRSSSPTSLLAAERGIFNSTRVVANECQHTNGIFVLGAAAVMRDWAAKRLLGQCQDEVMRPSTRAPFLRSGRSRLGLDMRRSGRRLMPAETGYDVAHAHACDYLWYSGAKLLNEPPVTCPPSSKFASTCLLHGGRAESVNVKNINISGTEAWISSPDAPRPMDLPFHVQVSSSRSWSKKSLCS